MSNRVVPANAETHMPCPSSFSSGADACRNHHRQGLWVPAFAGTTRGAAANQFGQIYPLPAGDLKHPTDSGITCFGSHNTTFGK
jgi:hypothetical protein